ncbi:RNA recognition motif domain protein [Kalmanozyma brasiliensis GHG001]|uniref:RNA recognition motif domain protein n=1 Tax=Kalmanozyma brasiliensis (strain GHG001) TaxID=1365824 RepID=UPI002867DA16|nr:RNA recognition motif domain protein [Kalmanozyma brasiliensis GHG001]KAF6766983.1 RNA recognition motif domain protein [Kalmanozyma brasiliensis GHG001]
MNVVREITRINQTELDIAINNPSASWHEQYKDSAYIFIGGLPYDLTEGDVIAIFSQYGEVVDVNLPRANPNAGEKNDDRRDGASTSQPKPVGKGKHRGFGFLMYEDQRSTVLAVDNLNGAQVLGRTLRVDHVASYKQPKVTDDEGNRVDAESKSLNAAPPQLGVGAAGGAEEQDEQDDLEDPMAAYFQRMRREGKGADADSQDREEKRRRKEERARIRAEREERRAHTSGSGSTSRRPVPSPGRDRHRSHHRGNEREDNRDHKWHRLHRDRGDDSEEEGVNRYEQMKKRSILDTNGSDRITAERQTSSRRQSRSRTRSRTPPTSSSSRRRDTERRDERKHGEDRHQDRAASSSHHHSSRRRSRSPRR